MKQRALTMVELLACLALLGLLSTALMAWVQTTVRASAQAGSTLPWEMAARSLLDRIGEDLLVGDLADERKPRTKAGDPRVQVSERRLLIRTRADSIGACEHVYELTPGPTGLPGPTGSRGPGESSHVTVTRRGGEHRSPSVSRLLVNDVAQWDCQLDAKAQRLTVRLTSPPGQVIRRSFRWR